jgi:hypothetical protein
MERIKTATIIFFLGIAFISVSSDRAFGYPPFLKQVQELGYEARNCTFCHQTPKGGKGWNDRGLWLKGQKKERKAPVVDVKWLKDYKTQPAEESKNSTTTKD